MPTEGLIHTGSHTSTVLGVWLRCAPVPGLRDHGHAYRTVLRLQLAGPLSGTKFDDVVVPFRRLCVLPESWLHNGFGSMDDYGHLEAFTMLVVYSLCLLLTALPNSGAHFKEPACVAWAFFWLRCSPPSASEPQAVALRPLCFCLVGASPAWSTSIHCTRIILLMSYTMSRPTSTCSAWALYALPRDWCLHLPMPPSSFCDGPRRVLHFP
ncbi:unnamed protein product [Polarella glacialis]|uniref:Uncharacterized protein n=1 Tax=Polarella glacialis TaxID=89957 RepID=A0A813IYN1_POLGL|nr:unnamed protein product [Polarella glacialis]